MPTFQEVFRNNTQQPILKPEQNYLFSSVCNRFVTTNLINPTGPYNRALQLPKVPVIQPYNPNAEPEQQRHSFGFIRVLAALEMNSSLYAELAAELGVDDIKTFIVFQTNPWKNVRLLYRPHPFFHSDEAEWDNGVNTISNISIAFSNGVDPFVCATPEGISTHDGGTAAENGRVYSPDNLPVTPILTQEGHCDATLTYTFSSIAIDRANTQTGRPIAVKTLHVVLNDLDTLIINRICDELNELLTIREPKVLDFLDKLFKASTSIDLQQVQHFCCGLTPPLAGTPPKFDYTQINLNFAQLLNHSKSGASAAPAILTSYQQSPPNAQQTAASPVDYQEDSQCRIG